MKKLYTYILIVSACLLLLAGCNKENKKVEEEKENPNPVAKEEKQPVLNRFPLTGVEHDGDVDGRIIAVTINNEVAARPQSGLNDADIVFEMLTEANITRFLALYQSTMPEKFGPVRSARDYFIHLAKGYDALYIAHGYSPEAKKMLLNGEIDNINGMQYDGTLFKRADFRVAPHNSYITSEAVYSGAEQLNISMEKTSIQNSIIDSNAITGEQARSITIAYGSSESYLTKYQYDEEKGYYLRYQANEQTIDYETDSPIQLDNLLIVEADHQVIDSKGRRAINITSGGDAYLLQKGTLQKVKWENKNGLIIPVGSGFIPGQTWVNFVPDLSIVSVEE